VLLSLAAAADDPAAPAQKISGAGVWMWVGVGVGASGAWWAWVWITER
jgi:hypothetical protein